MSSEEGVEIHRDVLEIILSYVPLSHLLPATVVSKSWNAAVYSSLRRLNKPKPWLLVHTQSIRNPHVTTSFAYDPRSDIWLQINQKLPPRHISVVRSSDSTILHVLTPSKFSFSVDPFRLTWHEANPPSLWRIDPVVTVVGHRVIVAGGVCDYEDDLLAVEIYDMNTRTWELSESMPESLKDSAASTWLSVAANAKTMYVMEKSSGVTHSFDPNSKIWCGLYNLRPDRSIYFSTLSFRGDSLIMVGLLGDPKDVNDLKVWEITGESLEFCREIGAIPMELVEELKGEGTSSINSIRLSSMAGFFYIYNPEKPAELLAFEVGEEGLRCCRSLKNAAVTERSMVAERMVVTCSDVDLRDLGSAVKNGNASFTLLN